MYQARRFATRHARAYEAVYHFVEPIVISFLNGLNAIAGNRLDGVITFLEKHSKGALFDCKMCGNCVLSSTGMTCPMNCPKTIRNGPCGGVRADGNCEVKPDMKCVWVQAWDGASRMKDGQKIHTIQFAVDRSHQGTSAWIRMAEEQRTDQAKNNNDKCSDDRD